jgi:serine/threonine protein kinase
MSSKISLTITQGKLPGKQYIFENPTIYIIGKNSDCHLKLPNDKEHEDILEYHCLLDINPPQIRVRVGSLSGTNGPYELKTGDTIKLGDTLLQFSIEKDKDKIKIPSSLLDNFPGSRDLEPQPITKHLLDLAEDGNISFQGIRGYNLVKQLVQGDLGETHLAQHSQTNKYIALKVILPKVIVNQRTVQMFLQEAETAKSLEHPSIVDLIDCGYAQGIFFCITEHCDRGTISDLMQQLGGRLSIDIAVPMILQVLDALKYAHNTRGLVHRDLKPSNILLSTYQGKLVAKVGDYGLAKAYNLAGLSGQLLTTTPTFMPRQQILNFRQTLPELDVWAAAACLYNMLTGAFVRNFTDDPYLAVLENDPVPIRQRNTSIPSALAEVIDLALGEKPEIYFKSADDFKWELLNVV